ncbi:MAG: hypothetical protein Q4G33_14130 [bacterium]|nr:hypothetical protein [bacterium]
MYNHKNHSKVFLLLYIALVAIIFIAGIVAGFVFKDGLFDELFSYSSRYSRESFNWTLAFVIWLSDIIPAVVLYAIYSHLDNQEVQINILNAIRESNSAPEKNIKRGSSAASSTSADFSYESLSALSFDELKRLADLNGIEVPLTKTQLVGRILARIQDSSKPFILHVSKDTSEKDNT